MMILSERRFRIASSRQRKVVHEAVKQYVVSLKRKQLLSVMKKALGRVILRKKEYIIFELERLVEVDGVVMER